jgi:Fic family protein
MSPTSLLSEATLRRVRAEFLEMPGLKLTLSQAQRLWGMDRSTCEALIEELMASRFLAKTRDGAVVLRETTA